MRDFVYFSGKNLNDFDLFATNAGVYSAPAHNYDSIPIAGRNGNLMFENDKYDNVEHSYPIVIFKDFDRNYAALKSYLLSKRGYNRLTDSFYADEFYLANFARFDSLKQEYYHADKGTCILVFERKPQRFLKSGEKTLSFTSSGAIKNPTSFNALPLLRVYGAGTLTIGDTAIVKNNTSEYLDIDCDLQEVLQTGGNLEITLTNGEFPKLTEGNNTITLGTGITRVYITPRWWRL